MKLTPVEKDRKMRSFGGIYHPPSSMIPSCLHTMQGAHPSLFLHSLSHQQLEMGYFCNKEEKISTHSLFIVVTGAPTPLEIQSAYLQFGEDFLQHLPGDFALALYDTAKKKLIIARGPVGKKPLYWANYGGYFLFASDLKSLLATGIVPQNPSTTGLASYLYFGYIPQDLSAIDNVHKLLPGYYMTVDADITMRIFQFWSLSSSLKSRKIDAPPIPTFTPPKIAPHQCLDHLVEVVSLLDEPIADIMPLQLYAAFSSKNALKSIVAGVSPFEMPTTAKKRHYSLAYRLARLPRPLQKKLLFPILPNLKWRILRNIDINEDLYDYLPQIELFNSHSRKSVSPFLFKYFDPESFFERFHRLSHFSSRDQIFYLNAKTKLPDSQLFQYDHLASAFDIDVQTPFAEKSFIEEAALTPPPPTPDLIDNVWCEDPLWHPLFAQLTTGRLVEEGLINKKWLQHHLGYPHLIPKTFKRFFAILILEIWFRLYIQQPIHKIDPTLSLKNFFNKN